MTNTASPTARRLVAGGLALCLSGCISLFPAAKPIQLYRFGPPMAASTAAPVGEAGFSVRPATLGFQTAAASDRILTIRGEEAAYIAGGRWISPAAALFESAMNQGFVDHGGPARLLAAGEPGPSDYVLKVDVRRFEVRYGPGAATPPTIAVEVYAVLADRRKPDAVATHVFAATTPATVNSVRSIVSAFDTAVQSVVGDLVKWVGAKGRA